MATSSSAPVLAAAGTVAVHVVGGSRSGKSYEVGRAEPAPRLSEQERV
jgi:hypothetical protein